MQRIRISACCVLLLSLLLRGQCQELNLNFNDSKKTWTIESGELFIRSEWQPPVITPSLDNNKWKFIRRSDEVVELAGLNGNCITDVFSNGDIELQRQVWQSSDRELVAVRQKMINKGNKDIQLESMTPVGCIGERSFRVKNNPAPGKWNILVEKRFKNDVPEAITPSRMPYVKADPFFTLPAGTGKNGRSLLIGFMFQADHLAQFDISFDNTGNEPVLKSILGKCEFNSITLPSQSQRTTAWAYITVGSSLENVIRDYTGRVARYHHVAAPLADAPSVFCSWYYHAWSYDEELFKKDIAWFRNNPMPFDVFLIDECWDVGNWGDMMPNEKWPSGMKKAASAIKEAGYKPGIWTCPYLVDTSSQLARLHKQWTLRNSKGEQYIFRMNNVDHWVLDPTYPGVTEYLEEVYRRISKDWGYQYFKFDFMRAVVLEGDYILFNPYVTRLQAYRMGLEAIRRGVGNDAYISVCGGHYGGSLGIANSQRSGSDVVSYWARKEIPKYRQNILRTWMSGLWHVDPDAMMVRRSDKKINPGLYEELSLGKFTDAEAQINALNQYIGGGLVSFTEDFSIIDEDRRKLYSHVIPSVNASSFPMDWQDTLIPSYMVTRINPVCKELEGWNTVSIVNWKEEKQKISFQLAGQVTKGLQGTEFLLFEFFSQKLIGLYKKGDLIQLGELAPHTPLLIKIIPWNKKPTLIGTDLHFSMGGVEISDWKIGTGEITGKVDTKWQYPVLVTAVFPGSRNNEFEIRKVTVQPGQRSFRIGRKG